MGGEDARPNAAAHLLALIESTHDLIFSVDLDYRLVTFNQAFARNTQESWGAIPRAGMGLHDLLPPFQAALWPPMFARAVNEGPYHTEYTLKDGRWLELSFNPITVDGASAGVSVFGKDITERKAAEEFRIANERRFRTLIEHSPIAIAMGRDGIIFYVNQKYVEMFGMESADQVVGQTIGSRWAPEWRPIIEERARRRAAGDAVPSDFEAIALKADGTRFTVHIRAAGVELPDGPAAMVFLTDVTVKKMGDEALRTSEARFRSYFNLPLVGAFVTSTEKGFIEVNDRLCAILGYSRDELAHKKWAELTHPDDLEAEVDQFNRLLAGEIDAYTLEKRFLCKDGHAIWAAIGVGCVRKADGSVNYICGNMRDISERKRAEEALRASESLFRTFFEKAPTGIGFGRNGAILFVNPKYLEIYRCQSPDEVIGQSIVNQFAPEDRPFVETALAQPSAEPGALLSFDVTGMRPDGSRFPLHVDATNVELSDGPASFAFITDMTERKAAEEALWASEVRFRTLVENAPSAITISRNGNILYANAKCAQILGEESTQDMVGKPILEYFSPDTGAQIKELSDQYREGVIGSAVCEGFALRGQGMQFPVHIASAAVSLPDGPAILTFLTDIAARKAAEELIRETERQYRDIFTEAPEGIFRVSESGELLALNPAGARMLGYPSSEAALAAFRDVKTLWLDSSLRSAYLRLLNEQGEVRDYECELRRKDGTGVSVSLNARRICSPDGRTRYHQGYYVDLSEKKRLEQNLKDRLREIQLLSEMNNALLHAATEEDLLKEYCRIVVEVGGYRMAWVGFAETDARRRVVPLAHFGHEDGYLELANVTWDDSEQGHGPVGQAMTSGQIVAVEQFSTDPRTGPWRDEAARRGYQSSISIPIRHSEGGMACLTAYGSSSNVWSESELHLMKQIAAALGFGISTVRTAIARDRIQRDLHSSLEQTIEVISETVDQRDPYTAGHQKRVADLCARIGLKMGLDPDRIQGLRLAATIHDLGKIGIPAEILSKPGRLTPIQFEMIKEHVQLGSEIVRNVRFPWPIGEMIRQHHERMDGSGYPRGLQRDDILLESRILAVADVVEAMGSHRPYRAARGIEVALAEIIDHRGKIYDAEVVDSCVSLFREDGYAFPS